MKSCSKTCIVLDWTNKLSVFLIAWLGFSGTLSAQNSGRILFDSSVFDEYGGITGIAIESSLNPNNQRSIERMNRNAETDARANLLTSAIIEYFRMGTHANLNRVSEFAIYDGDVGGYRTIDSLQVGNLTVLRVALSKTSAEIFTRGSSESDDHLIAEQPDSVLHQSEFSSANVASKDDDVNHSDTNHTQSAVAGQEEVEFHGLTEEELGADTKQADTTEIELAPAPRVSNVCTDNPVLGGSEPVKVGDCWYVSGYSEYSRFVPHNSYVRARQNALENLGEYLGIRIQSMHRQFDNITRMVDYHKAAYIFRDVNMVGLKITDDEVEVRLGIPESGIISLN